jgi:flagellar motor protein MotB
MGKKLFLFPLFCLLPGLLGSCVSRESYMRATNALANTEESLKQLKRYQSQIETHSKTLRQRLREMEGKVIPGVDRQKLAQLLEDLRAGKPVKPDGKGWTTVDNMAAFTMGGSVLFSSGSAELTKAGEQVIGGVVPQLKEKASFLQIRGHTDTDPIKKSTWQDNMHLSLARAHAVYRFLARAGFPRDRMVVAGYGPFKPVSQGTEEKDKERNRRVEILIAEPKE